MLSYIYVYGYIHFHMCIYIYVHICMIMYMYVYSYLYIRKCISGRRDSLSFIRYKSEPFKMSYMYYIYVIYIRIYTCMYNCLDIHVHSHICIYTYINVYQGGETAFPLLDIKVKPKKGQALLWPSVIDSDSLQFEPRTLHEVRIYVSIYEYIYI
jgi:hypothetical protein